MRLNKIMFLLNGIALGVWKSINRKIIKPNLQSGLPEILDPGFGTSRGTPVDRPLIYNFISSSVPPNKLNSSLNILEIGDLRYSSALFPSGNKFKLEFIRNKVLDFDLDGVLSGDLTSGTSVFSFFDVIISTQVLAFTKDPFVAANTYRSLLNYGGILVGTEPQISQISNSDNVSTGDYYRFTKLGIDQLFSKNLKSNELLEVKNIGGWKDTYALLTGLVAEESCELPNEWDYLYAPLVGYSLTKN